MRHEIGLVLASMGRLQRWALIGMILLFLVGLVLSCVQLDILLTGRRSVWVAWGGWIVWILEILCCLTFGRLTLRQDASIGRDLRKK